MGSVNLQNQLVVATNILILFTLLLSFGVNAKSSVVNNHDFIILSDEYDNGYPEHKYHEILDLFIEVYTPIFKTRGGSFHILRDFKDGSVNAWAWRLSDEYHLEVPGGMSRYYLITEEGFITTICHEIGHLLGGAPIKGSRGSISSEGQSDYYSSSKCLKRILPLVTPYKEISSDPEIEKICDQDPSPICARAFNGMKSLTSYYAKLEKMKFPGLFSDSTYIAKKTIDSHPKSQCRLDTMKRGYFCPVDMDEDFSLSSILTGACHLNYFPEFARPVCWFKEAD